MNYLKWMICSTAIIGGSIINANAYAADSVSLNVTGNIIATTCKINSDSINKSIDLGRNILSTNLFTPGSTTEWVNFDINLDCPSGLSQATMTMHGTADTSNPDDMYQNTGSASNIAVQLQSQAADPLGNGKSITGMIADNAYSYKLRARVFSQKGAATSGSISSVVTATFVYQ